MLHLLEPETHAARLRMLLSRFRAQEMSMTAVLGELHAELEQQHRETSYLRLASPDSARICASYRSRTSRVTAVPTSHCHARFI